MSHTTTDHDEIRQWAEDRDGVPSRVVGTGNNPPAGLLRIDFPSTDDSDALEPMDWDEWFAVFEERELAAVLNDEQQDVATSRFIKLIDR